MITRVLKKDAPKRIETETIKVISDWNNKNIGKTKVETSRCMSVNKTETTEVSTRLWFMAYGLDIKDWTATSEISRAINTDILLIKEYIFTRSANNMAERGSTVIDTCWRVTGIEKLENGMGEKGT